MRNYTRTLLVAMAVAGAGAGAGYHAQEQTLQDRARRMATMAPERTAGGYVLQRDADIARDEAGPHKGGGQTVAYSFFRDTPKLGMVFRKRALKPGAAIGYHEQHEDEIYYVLSGRGVMTIDGKSFDVVPGTAILTRPGSSHGLKQAGREDLVILINYLQQPR